MDRKRQKLSPEKNYVQKECQDAKITDLERKLVLLENKLKLVTAELEQVKEERVCDKIHFETENCELKSEIDKYKEQCTELQSENERLQKYLQDFESTKINVEEKSQINFYNTDLTQQVTKVTAELKQVKEERARDKINFETEKCELESKINRYKERYTELQSENERLQKYLQDLESANIVAEKSQGNLCNTDLTSQITKANESNDDACDINSLPDEIIVEVFSYLNQNQVGQIARVCRRWNVLTKSPDLWKMVDVKFSLSHRSQTTVAQSLIKRLPSCVTSIKLSFTKSQNLIEPLHFVELCVRLQEKCPDIKELTLTNYVFSGSLSSVIDICSMFLQDVKNVFFHLSRFPANFSTGECFRISKIEVLELLGCEFDCSNGLPFSKMPHLKQLHIFASDVDESWFEDDTSLLNQLHVLNLGYTGGTSRTFLVIQNHGHNLKELYLCSFDLQDRDLSFTHSVFPFLKTICLRDTYVTSEGVISLILSHPSLQNVYVDEDVAESFAAHPFVFADRCMSRIVKAIERKHIHDIYYSHN